MGRCGGNFFRKVDLLCEDKGCALCMTVTNLFIFQAVKDATKLLSDMGIKVEQ